MSKIVKLPHFLYTVSDFLPKKSTKNSVTMHCKHGKIIQKLFQHIIEVKVVVHFNSKL